MFLIAFSLGLKYELRNEGIPVYFYGNNLRLKGRKVPIIRF